MKSLVRVFFITVMMLSLLLTMSCAKENNSDNEEQDGVPDEQPLATESMIVDHRHTDLKDVPLEWINKAKTDLHIAYGHTSHGSQIADGMSGLVGFAGDTYAWNNGGTGGALDLHDQAMGGDVGYYPQWVDNTRSYLGAANTATGRGSSNPDVNVIIWSWCGQASGLTEQQMITNYLAPMTQLETEYPNVAFVYMTGHTDGTGLTGNLHLRNQQIRDYCEANKKILFDFEDIESYDPDGKYFGDKSVTDSCAYSGGNWATEWQSSHTLGVDWYQCSSAHSEPLNANLKAYAAWWLWARLAGWDGGG
jgi:hypothetical protein